MADCTLEDGRLAYTPTTDAERQAYETGYHDHKVGRSPQLAPYTGPLYTLWLAGWDAAQTGQTLYTLEAGQIYAAGPLEIEIVSTCGTGPQARVTFAVFERHEYGPRTAQGSATVPASWLTATLGAHRARTLSGGPGRHVNDQNGPHI